jgi:hypothetical protein
MIIRPSKELPELCLAASPVRAHNVLIFSHFQRIVRCFTFAGFIGQGSKLKTPRDGMQAALS